MTRLAILGDIAIFLLFAAIGRSSHHEGSDLLGTFFVAAPFIAGWLLAAGWLRPYGAESFRSARTAVAITLRTWLLGGVIGLILRSILDGHVTPLTFAIIALGFNGALLCAWHAALARLRYSSSRRLYGR